MIRLYDNHFGDYGQKFELRDNKYIYSDESAPIDKDPTSVWELLNKFDGSTIKQLQETSDGNLILFAKEDKNLEQLPLYTLGKINWSKENHTPPSSFRMDTGNLMGVLCLREGENTLKIQVQSRFDTGKKQYFLSYLLSRIYDVSFTELIKSDDDILWELLLAFVFLWRFANAAEVGLFKQYHRFKYNDLNFRGKLDLDRHLKRNYPLCDRIAYSNREISFDNPINQLLRHAAAKIERKWPSMLASNPNARELLRLLKQNTPSWIPGDIQRILKHKDTLTEMHHPYFTEYYESLRRVARMLLMEEGADIFDTTENTGDTEISGVLFDGSWLWEEYLATVLQPEGYYHADTNDPKTAIHTFIEKATSTGTSRFTGPLYPDFCRKQTFSSPQNKQHCDRILDAKYKRGDSLQSKDLHQVLCYMFLTGATQGGLIFPPLIDSERIDSSEKIFEETLEKKINTPLGIFYWRCFCFATLPENADEKAFKKHMDNQEDALRDFASKDSTRP